MSGDGGHIQVATPYLQSVFNEVAYYRRGLVSPCSTSIHEGYLKSLPLLEESLSGKFRCFGIEPHSDGVSQGVKKYRMPMTSPTFIQPPPRLEAAFGLGHSWTSQAGAQATVWETPSYHLLWADGAASDVDLRRLWEARKGHQPYPVVLLAPAADDNEVRVAGPQDSRPLRELSASRVLDLLEASRNMAAREAASFLAREFSRLEEAVVPGLRVKDFLTPHFLRERLRWSVNEQRLAGAVEGMGSTRSIAWRSLFQRIGYQVEQLPRRGYLLRHNNAPVAVVHPHRDASQLSRLTDNGELPEGMVLADCASYGAHWGILAAEGRYRLFQRRPPVGPATGQYLEIDLNELESKDRLYLGILVPESLKEGGWLTSWVGEAKDFGEELRKGLEERLIKDALPNIARGLGEWLESQGADLTDRELLRQIEEAALTLVFRYMFLLHTEARGYLPIGSAAYRPYSARKLAEDSRVEQSSFSRRATQRWDRLRTLVRMIRTGDRSAAVPAYNGSLFAPAGFPGCDLLERAEITDVYLAPALMAIAFETDKPDAPGLDYAGLQIGHLGAIYETLLTLRLTRAPEDLAYVPREDVFRPVGADEQPEVTKAQLYYQTEAGGRKAGGVFYTRHEFVDHLLNHSLLPTLDDHLEEIKKVADRDPNEAARRLFDFSVLDPAMGSAHFLTAALDIIADRVELFLAEVGGLPGIALQLGELSQESGAIFQPPEDGDLLRRLILKRCIYGVDLSPMAVEVANVTLWLASFVPGLALSYLGSNLKCGDALIGVADPRVVGASDSPLFTGQAVGDAMTRAANLQRKLAENPDRTPEEVKRSEELSADLHSATIGLRSAFDLWAAEPLALDGARHTLETYADAIVECEEAKTANIATVMAEASRIAAQYRFFHWPLEFPSIFHRERPGFDVVVGNPPWNEVTVEELRFYLLRDPGLRGIRSLADRRKRIAVLDEKNPDWREEFESQQRQLATVRGFFSENGGYQLQGVGDRDLYQLFCERYSHLVRQDGRLGVLLPRNALLAQGARGFRQWLFANNSLRRLDLILNNRQWAFTIHPQYTIALLTGQRRTPSEQATFEITGPSANLEEFQYVTRGQGVSIQASTLGNARVVPLLPSQKHADVLAKMRCGVQFDALINPEKSIGRAAASHAIPHRELDETQQRALFSHPQGEGRVAAWKGRCFDQYDPHGRDPAGYCVWSDVLEFLQRKRMRSRVFRRIFSADYLADPSTLPVQKCRIAFSHVTRATDSRTTMACLIPPFTPLTNAAPYLIFEGWKSLSIASVLGVMNSIPFDWESRRYIEINYNYFILNMLCFPPMDNTPWQRIGKIAAQLSCVDERFADFAEEAGVECGPLTNAQRSEMRAEIDALVARAYDLREDELRFIFTDFTENAVSTAYRKQVLEKFEDL